MSGAPGAPGAHLSDAEVSDLVDGALPAVEGAAAREHLERCARCRRELDEARALLVAAREARGGVSAPPELWPLVAAATVYAPAARRRLLRDLRAALVLAAAALVVATAAATAVVVRRLRAPVAAAPAPPAAPTPPAPP